MLLIAGMSLLLAATAAEPPCRAHVEGKALDFWLGEWTVTSEDGKTRFGENRIAMAPGGCAILEHWEGATGGVGKSLFAFDAREGRREQVWVTSDTSKPGGLKHKMLTERIDGGAPAAGRAPAISSISPTISAFSSRWAALQIEDGRDQELSRTSKLIWLTLSRPLTGARSRRNWSKRRTLCGSRSCAALPPEALKTFRASNSMIRR